MTSFKIIVREPEEDRDEHPVVFMLHGYGSHDGDLMALSEYFPTHYELVSLRAPISLGMGGYAWYSLNYDSTGKLSGNLQEALDARDELTTFFSRYILENSINSRSVYLLGFSQGAILSYAIALNHPELFEKVACLSGYFWEELVEFKAQKSDYSLRFFCSHGTFDDVIPVQWASKSPELLSHFGIPCTYKEYPSGHFLSADNIKDLIAFLEN